MRERERERKKGMIERRVEMNVWYYFKMLHDDLEVLKKKFYFLV